MSQSNHLLQSKTNSIVRSKSLLFKSYSLGLRCTAPFHPFGVDRKDGSVTGDPRNRLEHYFQPQIKETSRLKLKHDYQLFSHYATDLNQLDRMKKRKSEYFHFKPRAFHVNQYFLYLPFPPYFHTSFLRLVFKI